ncbi:hypothetical protein RM52_07905 [Microbacterium hominis]|uniref:Uncharacterized protein n=1 Tax=Microbacterium hominis TaxID=162426 RepID=A0A0B4CA03_9MICO|nr:hypothetical protein RM52_07905 [Microbacterium hominis]
MRSVKSLFSESSLVTSKPVGSQGGQLSSFLVFGFLAVFSVAMTPASWWALFAEAAAPSFGMRTMRITAVWVVAFMGPLTVYFGSSPRGRRRITHLSRAAVRRSVPLFAPPMALWFAFVLWLGTVGAGVRLSVVAFALVLTCASLMTPVSLIGAASGRRWLTWVPPLALLALSLGASFVVSREVFRA